MFCLLSVQCGITPRKPLADTVPSVNCFLLTEVHASKVFHFIFSFCKGFFLKVSSSKGSFPLTAF